MAEGRRRAARRSECITPRHVAFFGEEGDRIHMMFNFFVNQHLFYALATHDIGPLIEALQATLDIPPTAQWAHFLAQP